MFHIVDSVTVWAQIQTESYGFGTFVATKIAEIQNKSDPNEWWWVATGENPADMVTRPTIPSQVGPNAVWQCGPKFLRLPIDNWPISQELHEQDLPDRLAIHVTNMSAERRETSCDIGAVIALDNFNSYTKLLRVTARVIQLKKQKTLAAIETEPTVQQVISAEVLWIRHVQKQLLAIDWQTRFRRLGPSMNSNGLIVVGQRMSKWLKDNWNQDSFILLPACHKFTKLYIHHVHSIDHAGVEVTLAKVQSKFWVPGSRKIIRQIKSRCVICRKIEKTVQTQSMGELDPRRLQCSPAFYHTSLDLFGPFTIRDNVKKRARSKAYGIIFNCMATRAVYLDVVDGYGTQNFLATFRRFATVRGYPASIHSDNASQLVAANKQLREISKNLNWPEICRFGTLKGLTWTFNRSADAPWLNGCSEALIRLVKRALLWSVGETIMTVGELQTVLFEVANLLNERPIGYTPGADPNLGAYLCPNDLILGRTGIAVPQGPFRASSLTQRFQVIQRIVTCFWKKWQRDFFSTLLIRQKWHVERRNLRPGDIVLVPDSSAFRGQWKMAEVLEAEPGRDGKVRDVTLRYKILRQQSSNANQYSGQQDKIIKRSIHRLVLILEAEGNADDEMGGGSVSANN